MLVFYADVHYFANMPALEKVSLCAGVVILLLLLVGWGYEQLAERSDARRCSPPGRLIQVGQRRLHLFCQGSKGPTVIVEQGAGSPSRLWWPIQRRIADFARICTYDRAGYAASDPARPGRSVADRTEELHTLLANAQVSGPYLFVAHSYGGLIVRQFALRYPEQTAGLILVDTPDEPALLEAEIQTFYGRMRSFVKVLEALSCVGLPRLLRHIPALREGFVFVQPKEYAATADDLASIRHLYKSSVSPGMLGDMPVVLITHGQPFPGPFAILEKGWPASQQRLAGISHQSILITAEKSNHMIHLDEPDIVVDAVLRMHQRLSKTEQQ
jgi:pimeloyl-ACP methyl ester carboxylesterase